LSDPHGLASLLSPGQLGIRDVRLPGDSCLADEFFPAHPL